MNIIEKLGITPGPWRDIPKSENPVCDETYHMIESGGGFLNSLTFTGFGASGVMNRHDASVIAAAPEMLEALIEAALCFEAETGTEHFSVPIIEKAAMKTWEQIKELS